MLRMIVMRIYSISRIEPNKIIMIFIIVSSVIIFEIAYFIYKKIKKIGKDK